MGLGAATPGRTVSNVEMVVMTDAQSTLPPEFEHEYYRTTNTDLASFEPERLAAHFSAFGIAEGRAASPAALRAGFLAAIDTTLSTLEIGPFVAPALKGPSIAYADVLDREGLQERARRLGIAGDAPAINFVLPNGDLSRIDRRFAQVFSSHCIEHQPDLVHHLRQVAELLEPGGCYFLIVPDKRYCFDHFLPESTVADVLDAHHAGRRTHSLRSVVEHRALTTHNQCPRHWAGDHADAGYRASIPARAARAVAEYEAANGGYVDVHAWQFTPPSFRALTGALVELGLTALHPIRSYETPRNRLEFCAVLQRKG